MLRGTKSEALSYVLDIIFGKKLMMEYKDFQKNKENTKKKHEFCEKAKKGKVCLSSQNCNFAHSVCDLVPKQRYVHVFKVLACRCFLREQCLYFSRCIYSHGERKYDINSKYTLMYQPDGDSFFLCCKKSIIKSQGAKKIAVYTIPARYNGHDNITLDLISLLHEYVAEEAKYAILMDYNLGITKHNASKYHNHTDKFAKYNSGKDEFMKQNKKKPVKYLAFSDDEDYPAYNEEDIVL